MGNTGGETARTGEGIPCINSTQISGWPLNNTDAGQAPSCPAKTERTELGYELFTPQEREHLKFEFSHIYCLINKENK